MIRDMLTSSELKTRIFFLTIIFVLLFFGITILRYFLLPEGFLLTKNNFTDFNTSSNLFVSALQIFFYNMISTICIIIGSVFTKKRKEDEKYLSIGYSVFIVLVFLNAITLGTWSFTNQTISLPLLERILGMFMINKNAGLIEMFGLLLITCKQDILCFVLGIVLMFVGALIESRAIIMN